MMEAMAWVYEQEKEYMPEYLMNEIDGIADGMCNTIKCDAAEWKNTLRYVNMLPEVCLFLFPSYGFDLVAYSYGLHCLWCLGTCHTLRKINSKSRSGFWRRTIRKLFCCQCLSWN